MQQLLGCRAVHVRQEVNPQAPVVEIAKGIHRQARAQVGATDAHVHHVGHAALHQRFVHAIHLHASLRGHGPGLAGDRTFAAVAAQRGVQRRAVLAGVDAGAVEKPAHRHRHVGLPRQREQFPDRVGIDVLAGEAGVDRAHAKRQRFGARRLGRHQIAQRLATHALAVLSK